MNAIRFVIALLLGVTVSGGAWADHGHVRFGVMIGPIWGPWYYPGPYYHPPYYPPLVIEPAEPQVYVEQPSAPPTEPPPAATTAPDYYWYYCAAKKAYYPYVRQCPKGWQKVLPSPPGQPGS